MKGKLPVSVVMVIYNEEKVLERALISVFDLANEIIIIHDGECTDNSLEISKKYTNKIFTLNHDGFCDSHRVFGFNKAKNDWILILDADEYLSKDLQKHLPSLINKNIDIYNLAWPIYYKEKFHYSMYKSALFRKSKVYFLGAIHEFVKPINDSIKTKKSNFPILHLPKEDNYTIKVFISKNLRWANLQSKQLVGDFKKIPKWHYDGESWDFPTNLRLRHTVFFGMFISPIYHMVKSLGESIASKDTFFIWKGFLMSIYFFYLYYNVTLLKIKDK